MASDEIAEKEDRVDCLVLISEVKKEEPSMLHVLGLQPRDQDAPEIADNNSLLNVSECNTSISQVEVESNNGTFENVVIISLNDSTNFGASSSKKDFPIDGKLRSDDKG